jgi:nicotinamidase-related amidase
MNEALLVIDMQKKFHKGIAGELMDKASEKVNEVVDICRRNGIAVVWIKHSNKRMGLVDGKDCFEYIDSIQPSENEIKITKTYGNGFKKTELNQILKEKGITTVYLCGFAAEGCVHNTYMGAKRSKYEAFKIEDAIGSNSNLLLRIFGKLGKRISISEIEKSIQ